MLTTITQAAIALLYEVYSGIVKSPEDRFGISTKDLDTLLQKLTAAGIIYLEDKEQPQMLQSYKPTKESDDVSLLDILEATGEHLNCNHPTTENFYMKYGRAARKLGVVNRMTRMYLQEIKLYDL